MGLKAKLFSLACLLSPAVLLAQDSVTQIEVPESLSDVDFSGAITELGSSAANVVTAGLGIALGIFAILYLWRMVKKGMRS